MKESTPKKFTCPLDCGIEWEHTHPFGQKNKIAIPEDTKINEGMVTNPPSHEEWVDKELEVHEEIYLKGFEAGRKQGLEEARGTTRYTNEGKDELYCNFWRCLSCENGNNPQGSKYCLQCGKKFLAALNEDKEI